MSVSDGLRDLIPVGAIAQKIAQKIGISEDVAQGAASRVIPILLGGGRPARRRKGYAISATRAGRLPSSSGREQPRRSSTRSPRPPSGCGRSPGT